MPTNWMCWMLLVVLVDMSMLKQSNVAGELRFTMLETLREYGLEQLEKTRDVHAVRKRHATFYLALAEKAERTEGTQEQVAWLEHMDLEHDNLRAALAWSIENDVETGLRLAGATSWYWNIRGYIAEGRSWLDKALAQKHPGGAQDERLRAKALRECAGLAWTATDYNVGKQLVAESVRMWRVLQDNIGLAEALITLTLLNQGPGMLSMACAAAEESVMLLREVEDPKALISACSSVWVQPRNCQHDYATAQSAIEECIVRGVACRQHTIRRSRHEYPWTHRVPSR